jgi:hypothetical protein
MSQARDAVEAARNIRLALQNLNELVEDAYKQHEIRVLYEIRSIRSYYEAGTPEILAVITQELP